MADTQMAPIILPLFRHMLDCLSGFHLQYTSLNEIIKNFNVMIEEL